MSRSFDSDRHGRATTTSRAAAATTSIFGNLGQDDLIGGSSDLFGLDDRGTAARRRATSSSAARARALARNDPGDALATGHAHDADVILGDNGDIFRLVARRRNAAFLTFAYDNYGPAQVVPRAVSCSTTRRPATRTYTDRTDRAVHAGRGAPTNIGGGDLIHGEGGDDSIHGMTGDDVLFGDGQDDDIYGGSGQRLDLRRHRRRRHPRRRRPSC